VESNCVGDLIDLVWRVDTRCSSVGNVPWSVVSEIRELADDVVDDCEVPRGRVANTTEGAVAKRNRKYSSRVRVVDWISNCVEITSERYVVAHVDSREHQ